MSTDFTTKLKFRESPIFLAVHGIGASRCVSTRLVSAEVGARCPTISTFEKEMQFYVLPKLTLPLPSSIIDSSRWCLPDSECLADPGFNEPAPIDVIIGAAYYLELLSNGKFKATDDGPILQETVFGWIVAGRYNEGQPNVAQATVHLCYTANPQEQQTSVSNFKDSSSIRIIDSPHIGNRYSSLEKKQLISETSHKFSKHRNEQHMRYITDNQMKMQNIRKRDPDKTYQTQNLTRHITHQFSNLSLSPINIPY
ncbi:uncharacterized protein LOC131679567 [Topomyia yanbarensis]|uniref:uncharacterized protein LOC131679567 n=1 Tax=Topomyia yanbarensis TaxID=2498891 RepID=UPI00273B7D62|nr:uncharacterized protein LOC131679567 [Topomyia yanbarensis]